MKLEEGSYVELNDIVMYHDQMVYLRDYNFTSVKIEFISGEVEWVFRDQIEAVK